MPGKLSPKSRLIKEYVEKFSYLPSLTIAKIIVANHGDVYNVESVRTTIRTMRGQCGERNRNEYKSRVERTGPIVIPRSWSKERHKYYLSEGSWLVFADIHVPFHDKKAVEAAISYAHNENITGILFNGDIQDCASISHWPQTQKRDFDKEIVAVVDFLDFIRHEFPEQKIVYKPGNHEYRLPRIYAAKIPELIESGPAAMENLLGFEERGIELLDYLTEVWAGKLPVFHGHEIGNLSTVVNPARGLFNKIKQWGFVAHYHRTSEHPETNPVTKELLTTWSQGCLCDLSPDYRPYSNWNHGFAIIHVSKDGHFEVDNRRILSNGKVV